ncbi:metallophosphoesterase [Martelella mediterranea]|uniref:Calcineurin-like phosphoesterase family protein n=1 Tax=Martelella mediterranea TaxID=293089 RepID=A0A4R3NLN1_9HYPH|nr:metallophosphoesterase [Martelella mediterranea]TCT36298.1 calcineurin-like phosphoesterase family protein [Martelella mediterranea]
MLKFIILSDLHLVPEGKLSHGLDTAERFELAISFVNQHHSDAAFVIINGDLADHGEPAAYERMKAMLPKLTADTYLTLGNHDNRDNFITVMGKDHVAETGCADHVIDQGDQRIIVLDTKEPEAGGAGRLSEAQLAFLSAALEGAGEKPVLIVLHHNITFLGVPTDCIILENRDAFIDIVKRHDNVRQVISGHVHMSTSGNYRGVPFCTIAGGHYNIEPTLGAPDITFQTPVPRREGPGQLAVVLSDKTSTVVHMENYIDRHLVMAPALFDMHRS